MTTPVAGVELGGTKCICILATEGGDILEQVSVPTKIPDETLPAIEAVLDRWAEESGFSALGLGAFGPLDLNPRSGSYGNILATPKPHWAGTPLLARFAARYAVPVGIETDVSGAALAEGRWGAAENLDNFVYVTVGTGVGAGIVVNRMLLSGAMPVEVGHSRIGRVAGDIWPGACSFHGDCVEGLASGSSIEARIGARAGTLTPDDTVWTMVAHALAGMLHNLVLTVAPQRILLGGGVMMRQPHLLERVQTSLVASLAGYVGTLDLHLLVQSPGLGASAGPLGAIAIALDTLARPANNLSGRNG
jgi:fructokinase